MTLPPRQYSVFELDHLRSVVEHKYLFGTYGVRIGNSSSRSFDEAKKAVCVEEMVRTHMIAGHTAEDLIASESEELVDVGS
jgi:hypothetical protein